MVHQQLIPWGISGFRPLNKVGGKTCQNRTASQAWHLRKQASEAKWGEWRCPGQTESEGEKDKERDKSERQWCQSVRRRGENKMTPTEDWGRLRGTGWARVEKLSQGGEWESRQGEYWTLWHCWEAGEPLHLYLPSLRRHRYSLCTGWNYLDTESQLGGVVTRPHLSLQPAVWWLLKHWITALTSLLSFWYSLTCWSTNTDTF